MTDNPTNAETDTPTQTDPVKQVSRDGANFTLLGTAHVSKASAEAVRREISQGQFDAVAVELCDARHGAMTNPKDYQELDLFRILKEGKAGLVAANLALSGYQRRIAEQFGIEPGAEMRAALDEAKERNLPVLLVDRNIGVTLKRTYRGIPFFSRMTMMGGLAGGLFTREEISEEEIERLKEGDILESTFTEFAERSEPIYRSLIDERDRYMAAKLRQAANANGHTDVLAVVGAGHLSGLSQYLASDDDPPAEVIQTLDTLPPRRQWTRFIPWAIVAIIFAGFAWGFSRNTDLGWDLVKTWVLYNGVLSAIGGALAAAHPVTIVTAFIAAPLTSLNPTIGAGFVCGAVEAWIRKPRVSDFATLRDDVTTFKGWWGNRVSRTLLVFFFTTLGSAIATWVAGFKIFEQLT